MRKHKKRLLSLVLALVLCLGLLPGTALAEDVDFSGMTDKFAEDTEEAVTWPVFQDMKNWNLLVNDEGRKYLQDGGWDYVLYPEFYDGVFLHGTLKDPYGTGVDIPKGATEVYADYYWMLTQYLDARVNLVDDPDDVEMVFDYLTMPFRYYLATSGYAKRVYTDEYGQEEAMYSKGNDHFVILSQQKAQKVRNESGVVYVFLFDLTTGKTYYDLIHYAEDNADYGWGAAKINWLEVENEAIEIGAGAWLNEFSREEVDQIIRQVVEKHAH